MVPAVLAVIARGVRMADQEAVAQPAAQPELPIGEPEALQPAAPPEEEQAQHVEDFLAQELEEADVQSLAQRSQRSHYDDPLVEAAFDHNQRAQREIVESVSTLLSQQPAMSAELLMLRQEDIQKFSVTMTQAPAGFRRRYDTGPTLAGLWPGSTSWLAPFTGAASEPMSRSQRSAPVPRPRFSPAKLYN